MPFWPVSHVVLAGPSGSQVRTTRGVLSRQRHACKFPELQMLAVAGCCYVDLLAHEHRAGKKKKKGEVKTR